MDQGFYPVMYSVIIPTLNSAPHLLSCLRSLPQHRDDLETMVVDGGSRDATRAIASNWGAAVLAVPAGRGGQLNAGAAAAKGDILIFLHSDTVLPREAFAVLDQAFRHPRVLIGTFRLKFDVDQGVLRFYSWMTRFDSVWTRFGDQCIVVRKDYFETLGRFPEWPLFEDVHFLRCARRRTKIYSFPAVVVTSSGKYQTNGCIRQQLKNGWLIIQYLCGRSPWKLAKHYEN